MTVAVFPGQGSQSIGMVSNWGAHEPQAQAVFEQASDVLGYDLWALVSEGDKHKLDQTHVTQPAMLAADIAAYRIYQDQGGAAPVALAGHSLGEYAALVAADALDFADAIRLVARRGTLMQQAVPEGEGGMAAILGLDDDAVCQVCEQAANGAVCEPVNFNAPGQVVVAGERAAVDRACDLAKEQGAKRALILPVSVPSHSSLMKPAAVALRTEIEACNIRKPAIPVIHNVDAQAHPDPNDIVDMLVEQLYRPVRWVGCVRTAVVLGATAQLEFGPGKVLTGLVRRIDRKMPAKAVFDEPSLATVLAEQ
ncbi:MAG TPA: [acyl-carrier-protein] S-malonyltransferase [Halothiobacillaceae bacterium]|nr:[acyl-carrier-protein] S-malonyltransferase [Halothiobacillaceae bacterium]